jgi:hypothetical protein
VCLGPTPTDWAAALHANTVSLPAGVAFGVSAVAGDLGFGQFDMDSGRGVGELDLKSGRLTKIATYAPGLSGLGAVAVELPWVVWEQLDSTSNLADWSVHAWNQVTGTATVLGVSRLPGGGYVRGEQPLPVLRHGVVAWAQPVPGAGGAVEAQLRAVDLATQRSWTLDSGRISSPVYAGSYLIWAKVDGGRTYSLHGVDETTLRPVALPEPLRRVSSVGYLAGSPGYVAWSSQDSTSVEVWQFTSGTIKKFTTADGSHFFQFLGLAGHFLLWFGGTASSVLDLTTGLGFDVPGTVAGSAEWIVTALPTGAAPTTGRGHPTSQVSRVSTQTAPSVTSCV